MSWSTTFAGIFNFSLRDRQPNPWHEHGRTYLKMMLMILERIAVACGLWNVMLNVTPISGFSFWAPRSFAMQMTGIFVFLIRATRAPTPPRSPPAMPSTSSMMRHDLSVMTTPAAFVFCGSPSAQYFVDRSMYLADLATGHPSIQRRIHDVRVVLPKTSVKTHRYAKEVHTPRRASYFVRHLHSARWA